MSHELELRDCEGNEEGVVVYAYRHRDDDLEIDIQKIELFMPFLMADYPVSEKFLEINYLSRLERIYRQIRVDIERIELELADDHPHGAA